MVFKISVLFFRPVLYWHTMKSTVKETLNINITEDKPKDKLCLISQGNHQQQWYCFILSWSIYKLESVRCIKRDNSPSVRTLSGLISLFPCPYADLPVGKAVGWSQRCTWCSVTCAELWAYLPYIADIFLQGVILSLEKTFGLSTCNMRNVMT